MEEGGFPLSVTRSGEKKKWRSVHEYMDVSSYFTKYRNDADSSSPVLVFSIVRPCSPILVVFLGACTRPLTLPTAGKEMTAIGT